LSFSSSSFFFFFFFFFFRGWKPLKLCGARSQLYTAYPRRMNENRKMPSHLYCFEEWRGEERMREKVKTAKGKRWWWLDRMKGDE
jgi:hypothetical protein